MRITINVSDNVMHEVMHATTSHTKTEAVNQALKDWVRLRKLQRLREYRGRLEWEGNLRELRSLEIEEASHE